MTRWLVVPGMIEDGLHGQDGFYVVKEGDTPENDNDFYFHVEDAEECAATLNEDEQ